MPKQRGEQSSIVADSIIRHGDGDASDWVARWLPDRTQATKKPRLLDWACGSGRHCRMGLARGYSVVGLDRNEQAIAQLPTDVHSVVCDLEDGIFPTSVLPISGGGPGRFDVVIVCNYLFRPRLDLIASLVADGGLLIYETFARGNEKYGKPSNPDFLLKPGELLDLAMRQRLEVLGYEAIEIPAPRPAVIQRLTARRAE